MFFAGAGDTIYGGAGADEVWLDQVNFKDVNMTTDAATGITTISFKNGPIENNIEVSDVEKIIFKDETKLL